MLIIHNAKIYTQNPAHAFASALAIDHGYIVAVGSDDEILNALLRRVKPFANVAVLAGHSCIRTAVMGEDASTRAQPTDAELDRMRAMVREAMHAGAIGFASSFSPNHCGYAGRPMPSTIATEAELRALVGELGAAGRGVFVMATGARATPDLMESLAAESGRPMFSSPCSPCTTPRSRSAARSTTSAWPRLS